MLSVMLAFHHNMLPKGAKRFLNRHFFKGRLLAILLALLLATTAQAEDGWQGNAQVRVRLLSGVNGTGQLATIPLGLEVRLAPGWKTYWRMPGDAGAPPQLDWPADTNPNLAQTTLAFPAPERHSVAGLETIGYGDTVIFPLTITPKHIGAALPLQAKLTILTCAELCIPNDFTLALAVPEGEATPSAEAPLLETAQAEVPQSGKLTLSNISQSAEGTLTLYFATPEPLNKPDAFIETAEGSLFKPPQVTLAADKQSGTLSFVPFRKEGRAQPLPFTLTLVDGRKGWDAAAEMPPPLGRPIALHPSDPQPETHPIVTIAPPVAPSVPLSLALMLWFAFLGGLILNLMPCVLPVLSLKVLKFMGHGGKENTDARRSFLLSSIGILSSFWLIAALLIGLREGGHSVGWGIQFQHPSFLLFLMVVLLLFAANLWGLFTIRLPDKLNQLLADASGKPKMLGDFLTGAFAALLATPCTAPFLGTAVGFALAGDTTTILAIFTGMGLGMATPYLLVAAFPALATRMPQPGPWMEWLRRLLALALLAAALWFANVLWEQSFPAARDARWQPFAPERIPELVESGQTVFVDVTATWCITCQSNKKFVLYASPVSDLLFDGKLIAMQADWTRPDPQIAAYLKSFERAGIPFNVIYGPSSPHGIVLPELLTNAAVLDALDKAAGKE